MGRDSSDFANVLKGEASMQLRPFCLVFSFIMFMLAHLGEAIAAPKGAVRLTDKNLSKKSGFYCGYVKRKWIPGRLLSGKRFYSHAAERSNLQSALKKAKGKKKKKLQSQIAALNEQIKGRAAVCEGSSGGPGGSSNRVRFDLTGAVGLALANESQTSSTFKYARRSYGALNDDRSNLKKVLSNGSLAATFVGAKGNVKISQLLVGPNNTLYVLFTSKICLQNPTEYNCTQRCLLAQVSTDSGEVSCIESEVDWITWQYGSNTGIASAKPLQFDAAGNLYYLASSSTNGMYMTRLRRYSPASQVTEDMINQNIQIRGFLVLRDGSILLSGSTSSSNAYWFRKKLPGAAGEVINISTEGPAWLSPFPDGRIYLSPNHYSSGDIVRMNTSVTAIEPVNWFSGWQTAYNSGRILTSSIAAIHQTPSGHVYALAGSSPTYALSELYPYPHGISVSIPRISGMKPVLSDLIVFGTDSSGNGKMILYNTTSNTEVDLLGGRNIEVYRAEFNANENTVQFDGLRFSDGRYVLCTVNLSVRDPVCSPTGSTQLADFQSISTPGVGLPPPERTPTPLPLVSYSFAGAKALFSAGEGGSNHGSNVFRYSNLYKITAEGVVSSASDFNDSGLWVGFRVRGDGQGNIWLAGTLFLTDMDTTPCNLAIVNKSTGQPACIYQGGGVIDVLQSSLAAERTYFTATMSASTNPTTSLWTYYNGTATQLSANLGGRPTAGVVTSDGGILLAAHNSWVRKYTSAGASTDLAIVPGNNPQLAALADGRLVLVTGSGDGIKMLNSTGTAVVSQDWVNDVGCSPSNFLGCQGYAQWVFTFSNGSAYSLGWNNANGLSQLKSTALFDPVTSVPLTYTYQPYSSMSNNYLWLYPSATQSSEALFMGGRTTSSENKILSYNVFSETERDLTDDPNLFATAMVHNDGKLYLLGHRDEKAVAGVKDLSPGGGTTLVELSDSYSSSTFGYRSVLDIVAFNP